MIIVNPQAAIIQWHDLCLIIHNKEGRLYTTFMVPNSVFRFKRLVMAQSISGDIFNRVTDGIMRGLEGIHKSVNDILLEAKNQAELGKRIHALMSRFEKHGVTVS